MVPQTDTFKNPVKLNAANNWTYDFKDLEIRDANDKTYNYFVEESTISGGKYKTTYEGKENMDLTATDVPEGITSLNVDVKIGTETKRVTLKEEDQWKATIENVNYLNVDGTPKTISIEPSVDAEISYIFTGRTNKITNEERIDITGTKIWKDGPKGTSTNQDGLRPGQITIRLYADGTEINHKDVTAAQDGSWSYAFNNLPKYKYDSKEKKYVPIVYSITEDQVDNYTTETIPEGSFDVTNSHTPFEAEVTVIKKWNDNDNQDGLRDTVTFKLTDGTMLIPNDLGGTEFTLTKDNTDPEGNWIVTKTGLPRRAAGAEINYSVVEIKIPDGYTPKAGDPDVKKSKPNPTQLGKQEFTITYTNEHTPTTVDIEGVKEWNDDGNRDRVRPQSIYITLKATVTYKDPSTGADVTETLKTETKEVTSATAVEGNSNQWAYSWLNQPEYNNGHKIKYTITETNADGKPIDGTTPETTITGYNKPEYFGKNNYSVRNTHAIDTTSIKVKKIWSDDNNRDAIRPTSVLITLYANSTEYKQYPITIDNATSNPNEWEMTINNLPAKENGQPITYTAKEKVTSEEETDVPDGYTPEQTANTTITNKHTPEPKTITGKKVWDDSHDSDGKRPGSITINVYDKDNYNEENPDPETIVKSYVIEGSNTVDEWSYTLTGLNKYKNVKGEAVEIQYVITEVTPDGYEKPVISGTTITNKRIVEKVDVPITKVWVDKEKYRPDNITIELYADGVKVPNSERTIDKEYLDEDGNWTYWYRNLPKKKNHGTEEIEYTAKETSVLQNYEEPSYPKDGKGRVIVNTIKDLKKDIEVTKFWDDAGNQDGKRPTSITVTLTGEVPTEDDPIVTRTLTLTPPTEENADKNYWKVTFKDVPIFHNGTEITYNVTESGVDNDLYTPSTEWNEDKVTITNTHVPQMAEITAKKNWDDQNNNDNQRPGSVTFILKGPNGQIGEPLVANEANGWKVSFGTFPVYANGQKIDYVIEEINLDSHYYYNGSEKTGETETDFIITNSHDPMTISYTVHKSWSDFDNVDGARPDSITVNILGTIGEGDNKQVVYSDSQTVVENSEYGYWTYKWEGLPKYKDKELVQYTITEDNVSFYKPKDIVNVENKEETEKLDNTITNEHDRIPYGDDGTITVNKHWIDDNNKYNARPGSIIVNLLADGEIIATAELNEENGWSYTFRGLYKYTIRDGKVKQEIVYSIEEVEVPDDYLSEIEGFDVYNTYIGPVPEITPPNTGVSIGIKRKNNILFEMILTLLSTSYTVVVLRKIYEK